MFTDVLADLPIETVEAAVEQYLSVETFFPAPGKLRETAMDLQMLALGIPTPAEAWGMVISANLIQEARFCETGARLRDNAMNPNGGYGKVLRDYSLHVDECSICDAGGYRETYAHPAVTETVKLLGGREAILTDNPAADRARFSDAYREVIARERMKTAMLPEVKEYVREKRAQLDAGAQIKQLTKGMTK